MPTDSTGREIFPIVDDFGAILPTEPDSGRHVDEHGEVIPIDDFGRPFDAKSGTMLPTNRHGKFVYSRQPTKPAVAEVQRPAEAAVEIDDLILPDEHLQHEIAPTTFEGLLFINYIFSQFFVRIC